MKKARTSLVLLAILSLVLTTMPVSAHNLAAPQSAISISTNANLTIAGVTVIDQGEVITATGEYLGGSFSYQESTNTLTLNNFGKNLTANQSGGFIEITSLDGLKILLKGTNKINAIDSASHTCCITYDDGASGQLGENITLYGTGSLALRTSRKAAVDNSYTGIQMKGNLTLSQTRLTIIGGTTGDSEAPLYGMEVTGNLTLTSSTLTINETNSDQAFYGDAIGISCAQNLSVNGGSVTVNARSCCLDVSAGNCTFKNKTVVLLTSNSLGISCPAGNLSIYGSYLLSQIQNPFEEDSSALRFGSGTLKADASSSLVLSGGTTGLALELADETIAPSLFIASDLQLKAGTSKADSIIYTDPTAIPLNSIYICAVCSPKKPTNLKVLLTGEHSASVSFKGVEGAAYYQVAYRVKGGSWQIRHLTGTTLSLPNLSTNTVYQFKVCSRNPRGISQYSAIQSLTTLSAVSIKISMNNSSTVLISWQDLAGESGYEIYRKFKNQDYSLLTQRDANIKTYYDTSQKLPGTYCYKVRAYRLVNGKKIYGSWSSIKKITITR